MLLTLLVGFGVWLAGATVLGLSLGRLIASHQSAPPRSSQFARSNLGAYDEAGKAFALAIIR